MGAKMANEFPTPDELRAMKPALPPSPAPPLHWSDMPRRRSFRERRAERAAAKARAAKLADWMAHGGAEILQREEEARQEVRREWARQEVESHGKFIRKCGPKGYYDHLVVRTEVRKPGYYQGRMYYNSSEFMTAATAAEYLIEGYRARGLNARIAPPVEHEGADKPPAGSDHSGGTLSFPGAEEGVIVRVSW